jgi:methionyl-tRNA formyltransferase
MIRRWLLDGFSVRWIHDKNDIWPGDICFMLGCGQLVPTPILERNTHNLVVHESDLPKGRGWSPLTWQIIEGHSTIPVCLLEAHEAVDSGPVYLKDVLSFSGSELIDEMRRRQAAVTFSLCDEFLHRFPEVVSQKQDQGGRPTFYPRRGPKDSELDPSLSISEQFEKIRCVDNERYPAFFYHGGRRYILKVFPEYEGLSNDV